MNESMVVRYRTTPEAAEENQRLVEDVLAELAAEDPGGLHYAVFRLADGVSFVHIVRFETEANPLRRLVAFEKFQRDIGDRLTGPVVPEAATLIGAYRFLDSDPA